MYTREAFTYELIDLLIILQNHRLYILMVAYLVTGIDICSSC